MKLSVNQQLSLELALNDLLRHPALEGRPLRRILRLAVLRQRSNRHAAS
jgi:hypothetical protein